MTISSGKDLLLTLLYVEGSRGRIGEPVRGITRLEKLMFLTKNYSHLHQIFEKLNFRGNHFGPFSEKVQNDVEALKTLGLLRTRDLPVGDEPLADELLTETGNLLYAPKRTMTEYEITDRGKAVAAKLLEDAIPNQVDAIREIKRRFNGVALDQLLGFVYRNSEREYTDKSRIRDRYIH